jgi:hypothetical protein
MEPSRPAAGRDHINGLSNELLVAILTGRHSAAAAAQTSVLSRLWIRAWTKILDLIFLDDSSPDAVDCALHAYAAPEMETFTAGLTDMSLPVSAASGAVRGPRPAAL